MKRLILVGSPRTQGRSASLADTLFETCIDECPEDELFLVPISEIEVGPCVGCDGCRELCDVILKNDDGQEIVVQRHRCVFDDDMQTVYDLMDDADEVMVVCPVYFSGTPGIFKCLLDRLQPYYWSDFRKGPKRPATLHVVGEGGDPHGHQALVSEVRSALAVAGFQLTRVLNWVGKIDHDGEIQAEATEEALGKPKAKATGKSKPSSKTKGPRRG